MIDRRAGWLAAILVTVFVLGACAATPRRAEPAPSASGSAELPHPAATVGPLFRDGVAEHSCTGSVLDSSDGDLILTAAHCVSGDGTTLSFLPGYDLGHAPLGTWNVVAAYAEPAWLEEQDPHSDFAILRVADHSVDGRTTSVEAVAGGNELGTMPEDGAEITVIGYNGGINDEAIRCDARVRYEQGFPAFDCPGFSGGSSGSPWVTWSADEHKYVVRALIGGLHAGGCVDTTSYSPAFDDGPADVLRRANDGEAPNELPNPRPDGC